MTAKILKEISEKIKEDYNSLEEIQKRKKISIENAINKDYDNNHSNFAIFVETFKQSYKGENLLVDAIQEYKKYINFYYHHLVEIYQTGD